MKIKVNINNLIGSICIAYPFIYEIATILSESAGRRFSIFMLLLLIGGIFTNLKKRNFIALCMIFVFILINIMKFGLFYVFNQDFYGLILFLLILLYFSDKKMLNNLERIILDKHFSNSVIFLFYFVLLISVLFGNGLQVSNDWGVSLPMLYGPYGLPHTLAYSLISVYSVCSILWHKNNGKMYLVLMAITSICLIWTGVRSAVLVLVVMLLFDYGSLRQKSNKFIIFSIVGVLFIYLLLFTDFITNNPVIQKSIIAAGKGSGITNGRLDFISYLWRYFTNEMTFVEKILGIGISNLRKYMALRYGGEIHAHNDFINVLIGMGIMGLVIYVKFLFTFCSLNEDKKKNAIVFIILFILVFFNGLYMYVGFVPCIPIIYWYVIWLKRRNQNNI